jgi:hypothetical protein
MNIGGNPFLQGELDMFSASLFAGAEIKQFTVTGENIEKTNGNIVCTYNEGYLYNACQDAWDSSNVPPIIITKSPYGEKLNFTTVASKSSIGKLRDMIAYKGNLYISTNTGLYKFNLSDNTFSTISTSYRPFDFTIIDGLLNITDGSYGGTVFAFFDGTNITTKPCLAYYNQSLTKFTDEYYVACDCLAKGQGGGAFQNTSVCFYDKDFNIIGVKDVTGSRLIDNGTEKTVGYASNVFGAYGNLYTIAHTGSSSTSGAVKVLCSRDGGDTWYSMSEQNYYMLSFKFFAFNSCVIIKGSNYYYYSLDGGNTFIYHSSEEDGNNDANAPFLIEGDNFRDVLIPLSEEYGKLRVDVIRQTNLTKTIVASNFSESSGYIVFSNGLKIQWMSYGEVSSYSLPIAFSNTNYAIIGGAMVIQNMTRRIIRNKTTTGFTVNYDVNTWYNNDIFCIGY